MASTPGTLMRAAAIGVAVALYPLAASAQTAREVRGAQKPTIVLVHGAFADGSSCELDADSARSQQHLFEVLGALHASQGSSMQ